MSDPTITFFLAGIALGVALGGMTAVIVVAFMLRHRSIR